MNTVPRCVSCDNCMLSRNETCTLIKRKPCEDYRAVPYISQEERDSWPWCCDATYFKLFG